MTDALVRWYWLAGWLAGWVPQLSTQLERYRPPSIAATGLER